MARQGAGADRGGGDRGADGKTLPRQRAAHDLQQRGLAAEQMGAAGDVEKQPMRRIERHQRREAVAPVGDVVQRLAVGGLVGVEHRQFGTDRAGIGERQADRRGRSARPDRRAHKSAARCSAWRRRRWAFYPARRRRSVSSRLMRSMGRRGSHRLRIRRRFAEKALITFPFHDPSPDRAMTVTNQLRVEHRRAPGAPGSAGRRMRRAHDPSRLRGRGLRRRRHPQQQRGDAGGLRGQGQLAAGDEIELPRLAPDFQHDGAERIAGQRVGGGAQRGVDIGGAHGHQRGADRGRVRTSPLIDSAPDSISEKSCRTQTSGRRGVSRPGKPGDEAGRRRALMSLGKHLMHRGHARDRPAASHRRRHGRARPC